jgi:hypothetical protein
MSEHKGDREDFTSALRIVRERFPSAVSIDLATSDQGYNGFTLRDVTLIGGVSLEATDQNRFDALSDELSDQLSSLGWDGVVGEDSHGYATVALTED